MAEYKEILDIALWIFGGFFTVVSLLLGWIGVMQRETKQDTKQLQIEIQQAIKLKNDEQDKRLERHDEEIHELALQSRETLTILKHKFKIK